MLREDENFNNDDDDDHRCLLELRGEKLASDAHPPVSKNRSRFRGFPATDHVAWNSLNVKVDDSTDATDIKPLSKAIDCAQFNSLICLRGLSLH